MLIPGVSTREFRSHAEFLKFKPDPRRIAYERAVAESGEPGSSWLHPAYCLACEDGALFEATWSPADGRMPNFRESLICPECQLNNRQRFIAGLLRTNTSPTARVYLYEQITAFHSWAQTSLAGSVVGSEYLGDGRISGDVVGGLRHEDAMDMSFPDDHFDALVSQDVFEHVPDIDRTLAEAARVLRFGGWMLFSIPFHSSEEHTKRRARIDGGEVTNILPPVFHGNPTDADAGSLVFYDHGWEILDRCRVNGFSDAYVVGYWSARFGHIGDGQQLVFHAVKGARGS